MDIEVRTDRSVQERGELSRYVGYEVLAGLGPVADRVVSAQVELTMASTAEQGLARLRCQFEVRPHGHAPLAVSRLATTGDAAVRGAVDDMRHVLERMFRRIDSRPEGVTDVGAGGALGPACIPASRPDSKHNRTGSARGGTMDIQVRTDYHVNGNEGLTEFVKDTVGTGLETFRTRLGSVQVHLSEESGARKGPHDLICMIEVRPTGHDPVVVRRHAATKDEAIRAAVAGTRTALDRLFGRLDERHPGAASIRRATH